MNGYYKFYKDLDINEKINYKSWGIEDFTRKFYHGYFSIINEECEEFNLTPIEYYHQQTCGSKLYCEMPYCNVLHTTLRFI